MNRLKSILPLALILSVLQADAQTKVTFYPNGSKEFEGEYRYGYNVTEMRDMYNFDTSGAGKRRVGNINMAFRAMDRDAAPQKIYNGKCTFYYDNGKVSYSGTYVNGVKSGLFSYAYYNGAKEAEHNFVNGMADGTWKGWYANGKLRTEQNYVALTDAELDTIYTRKLSGGNPFMANALFKDRNNLRTFTNDSLRKLPGNTFSKFAECEAAQFKNSHWHGDFTTYYDNGSKCVEMHYKNDVRTGKWYYRNDAGKVNVELTFTDGKISDAVNNMPVGQTETMSGGRSGDPRSAEQIAKMDSMRATMQRGGKSAGNTGPMPATNPNAYIKEHLIYPETAKQGNVQGIVVVKFMVNEDGSTSDFSVIKGIGNGCDEEAVRVVKSMPPWKPAIKDGKAVKEPNTLPVMFRHDGSRK